MEIQEPTDYVFQFDNKGKYWELNDYEVHMGLGDEVMLNSINYNLKGQKLLNRNVSHVDIYSNHEKIIPLFTENQMDYFGCDLISSANRIERKHHGIRIGVVIKGALDISLNGHSLSLQQGDTYILPAGDYNTFNSCIYRANIEKCEKQFFVILEAFPA